MKYRRLGSDGDYTFGQNNQNFLVDLEATAQAIKTRLQLLLGSWWRDLSDGLPLFQQILNTPGSAQNVAAVDTIIQNRIVNTTGVNELIDFSSVFDPAVRRYSFSTDVQTVFSTESIAIQEFL